MKEFLTQLPRRFCLILWWSLHVAVLGWGGYFIMTHFQGKSAYLSFYWTDYKIQMPIWLAILVVLGFVAIISFLYRIIYLIIFAPWLLQQWMKKPRWEQGLKYITHTLTYIAEGDLKAARGSLKQAQKLIPATSSDLPLILKAQIARMDGHHQEATHSLELLKSHQNTNILGERGLITLSIDQGDLSAALIKAEQAAQKHKRNYGIQRLLYDLYLKTGRWNAALDLSVDLLHLSKIDKQSLYQEQAALMVIKAETLDKNEAARLLKRAVILSEYHVGIVCIAARALGNHSLSILKKAWMRHPHPDLFVVWQDIKPAKLVGDKAQKWAWDLLRLTPNHPESILGMAQICLEQSDIQKTREWLEKAHHHKSLFDTRLKDIAQELRLPMGDDQTSYRASSYWQCVQTHQRFNRWQAVIAQNPPLFNTIQWIES
jgi:uncharacterized membrane-anchored protein